MKMSRKALYAGTFDPFTNGHHDIVTRGLSLFDEIVILVAVPPAKKPFLPEDARLEMLGELFKNEPRIKVESWSGLVVDYAKKNNVNSIIRGLRSTADFEVEYQMASMNKRLEPSIDTVFLMTSEKYYFVSSSLVKEVFNHGGDVKDFLPKVVLEKMKQLKSE